MHRILKEEYWSLVKEELEVMQNRKEKLLCMGPLPEAGVLNKGGHSKRITWCLELEKVLAEIVELGERNDALAKEAFTKSTINLVIGLFPADIRRDMKNIYIVLALLTITLIEFDL